MKRLLNAVVMLAVLFCIGVNTQYAGAQSAIEGGHPQTATSGGGSGSVSMAFATATFTQGAGNGVAGRLAKWVNGSTLTYTNWSEPGGNLFSTGSITASSGTFNYVQAATFNATNSEYQVGGVAVITSSRAIIGTSGTFTGVVTAASFSGSASGLTGFPNTVVCQSGAGAASVLCQGVGGAANSAGGTGATVSGGTSNSASVTSAAIGGGTGNSVSGVEGVISGGSLNDVQGNGGMIPGGVSNSAIGSTSFAAGNRAKSNAAGCFTWADSQAVDFPCNTTNSFRARSAGEMYFETPRATFTGIVKATGLELPTGSTLAVSGAFTISTSPTAGTAGNVAFQINQSGVITSTTQYRTRLIVTTPQAIADTTNTPIFFDAEETDVGNMHSTSVSSDTVTIPADGSGWYFIQCAIRMNANAIGGRFAQIYVNGVERNRVGNDVPAAGLSTTSTLATAMQLNGGDTVKCTSIQTSGGSLSTTAAATVFVVGKIW